MSLSDKFEHYPPLGNEPGEGPDQSFPGLEAVDYVCFIATTHELENLAYRGILTKQSLAALQRAVRSEQAYAKSNDLPSLTTDQLLAGMRNAAHARLEEIRAEEAGAPPSRRTHRAPGNNTHQAQHRA